MLCRTSWPTLPKGNYFGVLATAGPGPINFIDVHPHVETALFPAAGHVAVKDRVNAIALATAEDFRRDSDLFGEGVRNPDAQSRIQAAMKRGFQPETRKWTSPGCWATWLTVDKNKGIKHALS